jgi:uncharacterized repeat protein (TIGR02543 family)
MKHKLISVALIAILLFLVLGSSISCAPPTTTYTLTMSSTVGGSVTPAVGAHTYAAGTSVPLSATPSSGYRFVNWTATAGTLGNANLASTNYTMPTQNATVTAHFALNTTQMNFIANVPDANQPPTQTVNTTIPTNFCAPMAMANVLEYWDDVANHANAQNVTAGLIPETVAEYLGYFMDTNNNGSPDRGNLPPHALAFKGTDNKDICNGTADFVSWNATNPLPVIPDPITNATLPAGKLGYNWTFLPPDCGFNYNATLLHYMSEINAGRPLVVSFDFWNPIFGKNVTDPQSGQTISVFTWGGWIYDSLPPHPEEHWVYLDIGHAVTGVGYILNWDPDGSGPLPSGDYVIVHDNWATTPVNVAIPWQNWMCLYSVIP